MDNFYCENKNIYTNDVEKLENCGQIYNTNAHFSYEK